MFHFIKCWQETMSQALTHRLSFMYQAHGIYLNFNVIVKWLVSKGCFLSNLASCDFILGTLKSNTFRRTLKKPVLTKKYFCSIINICKKTAPSLSLALSLIEEKMFFWRNSIGCRQQTSWSLCKIVL